MKRFILKEICISFILGIPLVFGAPKVAQKFYWYPTESNLLKKEATLEARTWKFVTPLGLLLYYGQFPWSDQTKYLESHDIADLPAWQGYMLAIYAFKEAVTKYDFDPQISFLADGFLKFYEVTGQPGLLGRSAIPDYSGPRLPWMTTQIQQPTKYWLQGPNGQWWRKGLAKDHIQLAAMGCAIPLTLDRKGEITLLPSTKQKLIDVLVPLVKRLAKYDFKIVDENLKTTEFGDLSSQFLNGFNQILVLHMLRSASFYDPWIAKLYEKKLKEWAKTIGFSFELLGNIVTFKPAWKKRGTTHRPKTTDMQAIGAAYLSLALQEDRRKYMKSIRHGMSGLWKFMKYERNPMITIPYVATIRSQETQALNDVIEDLRDYPIEKYDADTGGKITNTIQPLANRPYNTNYWKGNPFEVIDHAPTPRTGQEDEFANPDYLMAYWMGRYFGVLPVE